MATYARIDAAQEHTVAINEERGPGNPEARYECAICLNWLRDPALTSCGHRFCGKCITSWLLREGTCPIDQKALKCETDVFPDNYTRREISQILSPCSYAELGCLTILSPLELEAHESHCLYRLTNLNSQANAIDHICTFQKIGCVFKCENKNDLNEHLENELQNHLNLLMLAYANLQGCSITNASEACLWDAPQKDKNGAQFSQVPAESNASNLIHTLYERVVILEQKTQEQDLKIKSLTNKINNMGLEKSILDIHQLLETKYCNGVHIWKIDDFKSKLEQMKKDPSILHYCNGILTSPHGYGFCVRINVAPKGSDWLALHVHMMRTEHDSSLSWPFSGRINLTLVHPRDPSKSQQDAIMSRPEVLAFQRPICDISPRGFGYFEYTSLSSIDHFLENDVLTLKMHIQAV